MNQYCYNYHIADKNIKRNLIWYKCIFCKGNGCAFCGYRGMYTAPSIYDDGIRNQLIKKMGKVEYSGKF